MINRMNRIFLLFCVLSSAFCASSWGIDTAQVELRVTTSTLSSPAFIRRDDSDGMVFKDPFSGGEVRLQDLWDGGGDHGALSGLGDDDHTQYLNSARHSSAHDATFNNAMAISGDADSNATLGAHVADTDIHWKRPARSLVVSKDGTGQYATIAAALAVANAAASSSNPYEVVVFPGTYTEAGLSLSAYVSLRGLTPSNTMAGAAQTLITNPVGGSGSDAALATLSGNNTVVGIAWNQARDYDGIQCQGASIAIVGCSIAMGGSDATKYGIAQTGGSLRTLEVRDTIVVAQSGARIANLASASSWTTWRDCQFFWDSASASTDIGIYFAHGYIHRMYRCSFTSQNGSASGADFVRFNMDSGVAQGLVEGCDFSLAGGAPGLELRALRCEAGEVAFRNSRVDWTDADGTQVDLYVDSGATIYTQSSAWDSPGGEDGDGSVEPLEEGDGTFDDLRARSLNVSGPTVLEDLEVNGTLSGTAFAEGAYWTTETYQGGMAGKRADYLLLGDYGIAPDHITSGTMGIFYAQGAAEFDAAVYVDALTASRVVVTGASKELASSAVTATELGYVSGVTSALQTQLNAKQGLDATLTAWAAYNTNGLLTQTAADTFTGRTLTGDSEIVVANGNGVSGNPTLSIASSLARDSELPVGANPSATVNGTATNGSAPTWLRSDGAPALADPFTPADGTQNVTGSIVASGHIDSQSYVEVLNANAFVYISDTTASAKDLAIRVDGNIARFYELAGTAGDLFNIDLANKRVGIGDDTPAALFTVGSGDLFQVDSSGNIASTGTGTQESNGFFRTDNGTNGTPGVAGAAGDFYAEGIIEGDGNLDIGGTGTFAGAIRGNGGFTSSDGSAGLTQVITVLGGLSGTDQFIFTFKGGILTAYSTVP